MTKKMGRPVKGSEPLTKQLVVRMTATMHNNITEYAEKKSIGKMEVVRQALEEFFDR